MINPITSMISDILWGFNETVLNSAFLPDLNQKTIDQCIIDEVVRKKVLIDCNTYAGKLAKIPIVEEYLQDTLDEQILDVGLSRSSEIYKIPAWTRENRDITTVLRLTYFGNYSSATPVSNSASYNQFGNTAGNLAQFALNSRTMTDANIPPKVVLLADNMIRVTPPVYQQSMILECLLAYDDNFTGLNQGSINALKDLVVEATKYYIYNKLVVNIDLAALSGGQIVGVIKQIVDSYADSAEKYKEKLQAFRASCMYDMELTKYLLLNSMS